MSEKSEAPINKTGASEECGSTPTFTIARSVKFTRTLLRERVNEALFCDGLRLRGRNIVQIYADGPLPTLYRTGYEPIYESNVDLEGLAKTMGVLG